MAAAADTDPSFLDVVPILEDPSDLPFPSSSPPPDPPFRLFNRRRSVHELLGSGKCADVILWRDWLVSAAILVGSSLTWIIVEFSSYTMLSIVSNVLLLLIFISFVWANIAAFINKPPPSIPELHLSEDMVVNFASALRVEIDKALLIAHEIALGKDLKVFLKVIAVLWGLSIVGGWFDFCTLIYICIVISHTIPVIYERYEDQIDSHCKAILDEAYKHYQTISNFVAITILKMGPKEKKIP